MKQLLLSLLGFLLPSMMFAQTSVYYADFLQPCPKETKRGRELMDKCYNDSTAAYQFIDAPSLSNNYCSLSILREPLGDIALNQGGKIYKMHVGFYISQWLGALISHAVYNAKYERGRMTGLDGYRAYFYAGRIGACCWSPQEGLCAKLVDVMFNACDAVKANNIDQLRALKPQADSIIVAYRAFYPEKEKECHFSINDSEFGGTTYQSYEYFNDKLSIVVAVPSDRLDMKAQDAIEQRKVDLRKVADWLFENTYELDMNHQLYIYVGYQSKAQFMRSAFGSVSVIGDCAFIPLDKLDSDKMIPELKRLIDDWNQRYEP